MPDEVETLKQQVAEIQPHSFKASSRRGSISGSVSPMRSSSGSSGEEGGGGGSQRHLAVVLSSVNRHSIRHLLNMK